MEADVIFHDLTNSTDSFLTSSFDNNQSTTNINATVITNNTPYIYPSVQVRTCMSWLGFSIRIY